MGADLAEFAATLRLEGGEGEGRWQAKPAGREAGFVDAGTVAAYLTTAAASSHPDREIRSVRCVFLRAARPEPFSLSVVPLHLGSTFGAVSVVLEQDGRLCAQGIVTSGPRSADLFRHEAPGPEVTPPEESAEPSPHLGSNPASLRVVGGVDPFDPATARDPRWQVWVDARGLPRAPGLLESLLAFEANSFLVQAAVIGHEGVSHHTVHTELMAAITGCEVVFHGLPEEPGWLLLDQRSEFGGGGWLYGHGSVRDAQGHLVASFSEDAILRAAPPGRTGVL